MSAPMGNKFWEMRSTHGRKPIFESQEELWLKACGYFNWCHENPLFEIKAFNCGEMGIVQESIAKMRAMTITGLCFYLGISRQGWKEYKEKKDFSDIVEQIESVIYSQKFEGASAGLLNASIIAREIGLSNGDSSNTSKDDIDLEIRKLELEKLKREVNPPKIDTPDEDYKVSLKPDEEIPNEPIL